MPDVCRVRTVGLSRAGEPLLLLSVGHGSRNVLVVAGPHANEMVGGATALLLARRVAADPVLRDGADAAWHFLLCADPDGARLNEAVPGARFTHARPLPALLPARAPPSSPSGCRTTARWRAPCPRRAR